MNKYSIRYKCRFNIKAKQLQIKINLLSFNLYWQITCIYFRLNSFIFSLRSFLNFLNEMKVFFVWLYIRSYQKNILVIKKLHVMQTRIFESFLWIYGIYFLTENIHNITLFMLQIISIYILGIKDMSLYNISLKYWIGKQPKHDTFIEKFYLCHLIDTSKILKLIFLKEFQARICDIN